MIHPEEDIIERLLDPPFADGNAVEVARALLREAAGEIHSLREVLCRRHGYPEIDMQVARIAVDLGRPMFEFLLPLTLEMRHVVRSGDKELSVKTWTGTWTGTVNRPPTVLN